jgi:drug/metabolite transporter (DMT)-like permease
MLRSSIIIFTAILSVFFLKKKLYRHHLTALLAIILGIFLVGYSGIKNDKRSSNFWGIFILLIG